MANYIVKDTSLETVADSIRAKAGISEKLEFPLGWKAAVDGITGGGDGGNGGGSSNYREVKVVTNINAGVLIAAREPEVNDNYTHCLYNEARLPRPPVDDLAICPYYFIRYNGTDYQMLMADSRWYYSAADKYAWAPPTNGMLKYRQYKAESESWTLLYGDDESSSAAGYGVDNGTWSLVFSSYDMPNGSPTATNIYFAGSEPVPTE